jgi:sigma-B regulation protein RsbU (phosphoserine phosphatase)
MNQSNELKTVPGLAQYKIIVLLVDDQQIVASAVKQMLAPEADIIFHYCSDPTQAVQTAAEISPTVILQDLVMPEIDGLTLVKFYRAHPRLKDVPLIVLSTKEEAVVKADAFALGANDYIVKLPDRIELIARIRYHSKGYINLLQRNDAYDALLKSQQALVSEMAHAAEYVISLLPQPIDSGSLCACWRLIPSIQLGGDSFGYHWIDEDNFAMYLLDVCNHGVGPALLSVSVLNVLRSQSLPNCDFRAPEQVLTLLNDTFQMADQNDLYFTIWYGVFNRSALQLNYASGGHPPALQVNLAGDINELITPNFIIGGLPGYKYIAQSINLELPSDIYIFSDGVYEVQRPEGAMWTLADLKEFIKTHRSNGKSEIDELYTYLQQLGGKPDLDDDFTMMKIRFIK